MREECDAHLELLAIHVPKPSHEDLIVLRQARLLGQRLGQLRPRAAQLVVVEEQVVEHRELGVRRHLALADLLVQGAQAALAPRGVRLACEGSLV